MLAFESEVEFTPPPRIANRTPTTSSVSEQRRSIPWMRISFALVAAAAVIQAVLITVWWSSGRITSAPPETGTLTITSDPAGAAISIDGTTRGATPFSLRLSAGVHQLQIGSGAQMRTQSITVARGGDMSVHASFARQP